jgi:hypothetical protein
MAVRGDLLELFGRLPEAVQEILGVVEASNDVRYRPETGLRQVGSVEPEALPSSNAMLGHVLPAVHVDARGEHPRHALDRGGVTSALVVPPHPPTAADTNRAASSARAALT